MKYLLSLFIILASCANETPTTKPSIDKNKAKKEINLIMDKWHQAAAVGDEEVFFGSIADDGIYLGTDKTERWEKRTFQEWSQKYFERDTAWAFTPYDRSIYIAENGNVAWFEESLDTWMGHCRGSGVVQKNDTIWLIEHYNLAVTIDNEKITEFIELSNSKTD